jgi:hypothetical protein
MTKLLVLFGSAYVAAVSVALYAQQPQRDGPRYDGMSLVRPVEYREWPFLGSGLGLTYDVAVRPMRAAFHERVREFLVISQLHGRPASGRIRRCSSSKQRRSETNAAPNVGGRFQGEILAARGGGEGLEISRRLGVFSISAAPRIQRCRCSTADG